MPNTRAGAGGLQDPGDLAVATLTRVRERRDTLAVGDVHVSTGCDEQAHDLGVPLTAAAQDDGFQQRGPPEAIDMVDPDRCS